MEQKDYLMRNSTTHKCKYNGLFKRLTFLWLLNMFGLCAIAQSNEKVVPCEYTLNEKIWGLSQVWSEMKYNFVHIDKITFNIDSLYFNSLAQIIHTNNDEEYFDELQRFIASFNDGHTELIDRGYSWSKLHDYVPAYISEINKHYYFSSVRIGNSYIDTTALGAEILEVNQVPIIEYVQSRIFPQISASTLEGRYKEASMKLMQGYKGQSLKGKAKKLNGEMFSFDIPYNGEQTRKDDDQYNGYLKYQLAKPYKKVSLYWKNDIAVLEILDFASKNIITEIDSAMNKIHRRGAKGFILDLRSNGGGSTSIANYIIRYLFDLNSYLGYGSERRINDSYGRAQGNYRKEYENYYLGKAYKFTPPDTVHIEKSAISLTCPKAILIGSNTYSACEDFLVTIYELPNRPILIGTPTGGSTGAPLCIDLPHKAMARICSLRINYPYSGKPFTGGISPDIYINPTIQDIITDKDVALESAITYLIKKVGRTLVNR